MARRPLKSRKKQVLTDLERRVFDRTNRAVQIVRGAIVLSINIQQPTRLPKPNAKSRARGFKSSTLIGEDPSKVGEPPKRLTGSLVKSIKTLVLISGTRVRGVIFTRLIYARRLEFGFMGADKKGRKISQGPRPFMRPGLKNNVDRVKKILAGESLAA